MSYTLVAIPTLGQSPQLIPLINKLIHDGGYDRLLIMDHRQDRLLETFKSPLYDIVSTAGMPFYGMWNMAWEMVNEPEGNLVLLNDDIRVPDDFVRRLVAALRSDDDVWCAYPDYRLPLDEDNPAYSNESETLLVPTRGTYKDGGLWGCAFALRGELFGDPLPPIDEQFEIWCGDDDLVKQIELHGGTTCRVEGLALDHKGSVTFLRYPILHEKGWADVERFKLKYGSW